MKTRIETAPEPFIKEYEFRASARLLYPYLSTASGLELWFADRVDAPSDQELHFEWDGDEHHALITSAKLNKLVRLQFTVLDGEPVEPTREPQTIEFGLTASPISESVFLRVVDHTSAGNLPEDSEETWDQLVAALRETLSGR